MNRHLQMKLATTAFCLLLAATSIQGAEKWSRQLESTGAGDVESFDWIPLAQPVDGSTKDRSGNGRVLTYSQTFPPNARFGDLPKQVQAPQQQQHQQQPFDFPYQFQRFLSAPQSQSLRQPSHLKASPLQSQEPTSQSFFKFEMPFHGEGGNRPLNGPPTVQTGYQIQHSFGGGGGAQATLFNSPLYNQQPVFPPEFHPKPLQQQQQLQQKPLPQQNFIEDTLPLKNSYRESKPFQSVTPQVFPVDPQPEQGFQLNKPASFQQPSTSSSAPVPISSNGQEQQQDVQLLYVPYDTLYNQQQPQNSEPQNPIYEVNKYNVNNGLPAVNPYQINQFYTQDPLAPQEPNYFTTSTTNRPLTSFVKPAHIFQSYINAPSTTAKPKPKAHQPPLAMFILRNNGRTTQSDVVSALRNANTIAVIDAPTKNTPEIFVGPAGMPTPERYAKFELPYLSQLIPAHDLHDIPFFVAPLSYRTPNGFNKILLPEPHVGSIVVNRAKHHQAEQPQENLVYNAPSQNDINHYQGANLRPRPHRVKQPYSQKENYPDVMHVPKQKHRDQFEVTTQRATLHPTRGNKFSYFIDQDAIHEVTSPKMTKHDRPKKKRPQNVPNEQPAFTQVISNPYAQFPAAPNQILNDDFYKVQPEKTSTSTSTSTTTSTTSTTSTTTPPSYFTYNTSPRVQFQSTSGQLYPNFENAPQGPEEHVPRFTTRPPPSTSADDEYRMKQYFRQQDAFRNRPQIVNPTNPSFEQVQYTPVSLDYDREVNIPSTTHKTSSTTKQRITFYAPTATPPPPEETFNTIPPQVEAQTNRNTPINHRPSYNQNEILDGTVEYEPNPYQLPSELPPLAPNLPGLVNNLQEKDKQHAIEQSQNLPGTTTPVQEIEQEQTTRPTRRPINRTRKPVVSKVTSSVSYSESESSSRRPTQRVRRPYGSRGSASDLEAAVDSEVTTTTTRRPTASRTSFVRNPNRVRYQPTPEERQTLRIKPRKQYTGSKKAQQSEDLDYQRDVLKQNYPIIRPGSHGPTSPTAIPSSYAVPTSSEGATSETQQVYTVTPSNHIEQTFPAGILEPMQIAQQYNEYSKDNYGPGYFPNQEDLNPTEAISKNEINPVYTVVASTPSSTTSTTTTTTTEEPIATTTRRTPFIRRNYPRLRPTTTEQPTTTPIPEEKSTIRSRIPQRKVIKVRARTRRPYLHPASSTTEHAAEEEEEVEQEPKQNYRKHSRYNQQNNFENDAPKRRYKTQFQLEGQESQWSPALKTENIHNFRPSNPKEDNNENKHKFENEPEIVTAGPVESKKSDTYEFNVSANLGSDGAQTRTTLKAPNLKPEKSFAELLEEVMGKAPEEKPLESAENTRTTEGMFFESHKTIISPLNRRGKWKKMSTANSHNNESFETAESQNLGSQLLNSLYNANKDEIIEELRTTTPMTPASSAGTTPAAAESSITTITPPTTAEEYGMTTTKQFETITTIATTLPMSSVPENKMTTLGAQVETTTEDNATRRLDEEDLSNADDLETQPSLFSEVKKQLHELFSIEESDDQAVTAALSAVGKRRQEYTNIKRVKPETTTTPTDNAADSGAVATDDKKGVFHKNLMEHVIYATSTSKEVSADAEICYRGRCIRSEDLPTNHKLN